MLLALTQSLLALTQSLLAVAPLLAQLGEEEGPKSYNVTWGIVMLCVALGMMLTLRATKREPIKEKVTDV